MEERKHRETPWEHPTVFHRARILWSRGDRQCLIWYVAIERTLNYAEYPIGATRSTPNQIEGSQCRIRNVDDYTAMNVEIFVRAWLYKFGHPDFTRESSDA